MKNLLIDIGNTTVHYAVAGKQGPVFTKKKYPGDFMRSLSGLIKRYKPQRAIICSVVPHLSIKTRRILKKNSVRIIECGKEIKIPLKNLYKKPREVGQDRLLNVFAANNLYKDVRLIVDLGTALTFDFISKKGAYLGGLIFPGMSISLAGLLSNCALLPRKLALKPARILQGKSTSQCIRSGIVLGFSFLIGGLVEYIKKRKKASFKVLLTGGDCKFIIKSIAKVDYVEPDLSLRGLYILQSHLKKDRVLPTHQKATPVRAWMNGFRCGVSLQSETPNPKKPRL